MSYDVMVFNPEASPLDRDGFMEWYQNQTEWSEDHSYDDPSVSADGLQVWFKEMIKEFPAMNGPFANYDDDDSPKLTDYSIGKNVIYIALAYSEAANGYNKAGELAMKYGLGFFEVSEKSGGVYLPTNEGGFTCIHANE